MFVPRYMGKWSLTCQRPARPTSQQWYKYNPSEAKKLLEAAGSHEPAAALRHGRQRTGGFAPTPDYKKQIETINNMLNAVGVKTNIVTIDYNKDYVDAGKGSSQGYYDKDMIIFGGFSPYTEADEWLFSYFDSKSVNSHTNVKDPQLDAMIDKERTLVNDDERLKAVQDIQQYVADKMYQLRRSARTITNWCSPRSAAMPTATRSAI